MHRNSARPLPEEERVAAGRVDLAVFTCEGRGHLLTRTMDSFGQAVPHEFAARRVTADGAVDQAALAAVRADVIVQLARRRGYIHAIRSALRQIDAEYFFWLEDDWHFEAPVDVSRLVALMDAHPDWVQIRLSKTGRLDAAQRSRPLDVDVYASVVGFSANPCLCRTALVRAAFDALDAVPRGDAPGIDGFENVVTRWCDDRGLVCAVLDDAGVSHLGYLESTPRQWHMTVSLATTPTSYVPAFAGGSPPLWRRFYMIPKLANRFAVMALRQLHSDAAYETAFRVVTVPIDGEPSAERKRAHAI